MQTPPYFPYGLQISKEAWDTYAISEILSDIEHESGQRVVAFCRRLIERLTHSSTDVGMVYAGHLLAKGLIEEIFRYVIDIYFSKENPSSLEKALKWTRKRGGDIAVDAPLRSFIESFPPEAVAMGRASLRDFFNGVNRRSTDRKRVIYEMSVLYLAWNNPAFEEFGALFRSQPLEDQTPFVYLLASFEEFLESQPALKELDQHLFEALRAPILASPHSIEGQLEYILKHWLRFLPEVLRQKLLLARDILKEESAKRGFGPGPSSVLRFGRGASELDDTYPEFERFSTDADWMSNVVLIAKSTYVWLDQLSKKHDRSITKLDQIPDQELDRLARWGFNGLWLIGVWERSAASRKIKRIMGNPEAESSAYSLYDYRIAADLGGDDAYRDLKDRAWQRGIRLASDMVPNHVGIYSRWIIEHPDWFVQAEKPPYFNYRYNGEDLSLEQRYTIQIEDGYWDHSDAAVVFKRLDNWTGDERYIYHGNDGTHMPWNDTAQLNYLNSEVREAVIQTILHVARQFPIIRFDAAMTLAKRHYQRLWFPKPGDGGAIPSRAEHSMTREEFDRVFPKEFWREVVDRITEEAPDTLLLAEAFWLMEGYFVRTLGMHRVYNSAFMNMVKMEENANYRATMMNVLEYSPEILKRFVNFMNNPDERTAVEQFGKGDKYIGAALLMVTLPGLPMFGHGQIEGFTEKYGMEYRRAYWDEPVDEDLVRRHEAEIFPLVRKRYLFSGVKDFFLYEFRTPEGSLNENVYAYSNRAGDERALVLYNNSYSSTRGRIHTSTPINVSQPENPHFIRKSLAQALSLNPDRHYIFRDCKTGLEYLRPGRQLEEEGFYVELHGYQYYAFLDFREIHDQDGSWAELTHKLKGKGVLSIEAAHKEMKLAPMLNTFTDLLALLPLHCEEFLPPPEKGWNEFVVRLKRFADQVRKYRAVEADVNAIARSIKRDLSYLPALLDPKTPEPAELALRVKDSSDVITILELWIVIRNIAPLFKDKADVSKSAQWMEDWRLTSALESLLAEKHSDNWWSVQTVSLLELLLSCEDLLFVASAKEFALALEDLLKLPIARDYLGVNRHNDVYWISKEKFEELVSWLLEISLFLSLEKSERQDIIPKLFLNATLLLKSADSASYQLDGIAKGIQTGSGSVSLPVESASVPTSQ